MPIGKESQKKIAREILNRRSDENTRRSTTDTPSAVSNTQGRETLARYAPPAPPDYSSLVSQRKALQTHITAYNRLATRIQRRNGKARLPSCAYILAERISCWINNRPQTTLEQLHDLHLDSVYHIRTDIENISKTSTTVYHYWETAYEKVGQERERCEGRRSELEAAVAESLASLLAPQNITADESTAPNPAQRRHDEIKNAYDLTDGRLKLVKWAESHLGKICTDHQKMTHQYWMLAQRAFEAEQKERIILESVRSFPLREDALAEVNEAISSMSGILDTIDSRYDLASATYEADRVLLPSLFGS